MNPFYSSLFKFVKVLSKNKFLPQTKKKYYYLFGCVSFVNSNNQQTEVFDHDRGTNGTFQLHVEGDQNIFEVINNT